MLFIPLAKITLRAELTGADQCTAEETSIDVCSFQRGITATGHTPVLGLCRMLIAAGHDPRRPLEVFRGPVLALRIRSIGEAAGLTVEDSNRGTPILRRWRGPRGSGAASPMRQIQKSGSGVRQ